ncbi:MAG: rubrerythrin [Actinobacteria bacterium]|nr:rubrerythrin [Actinomycetota bacterium]
MMIWRCEVCGLLTIGTEPPETCVVCGVGPEDFSQVEEVEDVTGTETKKNLMKAFSGESQANRRYLLYARMAELESDSKAEDMFLKFASEETWHAQSHLLYLLGKRTTKENITESIEGETYEADKMYTEFAEKAKDEGFENIALIFSWLSKTERGHAEKFKKLLEGR